MLPHAYANAFQIDQLPSPLELTIDYNVRDPIVSVVDLEEAVADRLARSPLWGGLF